MSFWDKIKQQASVVADAAGNVAQGAVKQTKTLASVGRIKLAITAEEDKMKKAYTELGRLFYRDYEAQAEAAMEDYQPWCDKVADAKAQIDRLNEELEKVRAEEPAEESAEPAIEFDLTAEDPAETSAEAPADLAEESEVPAEAAEAPEDPSTASEAQEAEAPTVGTLYVDVTNTEE